MTDETLETWMRSVSPADPPAGLGNQIGLALDQTRDSLADDVGLKWQLSSRWRVAAVAAVSLLAIAGWTLLAVAVGIYRTEQQSLAAATVRLTQLQASIQQLNRPATSPASPASVDRVVETRGLVLALADDESTRAESIASETPVPTDRSLWTSPSGGALVHLADGGALDLDRDTEVTIRRRDAGCVAALRKGVLYVDRRQSVGAGVSVSTAHATLQVRDAQVAVMVDGNRTVVEVAEGEVVITTLPGGLVVKVLSGHVATIGTDGEPTVVSGRLQLKLEPSRM